MKVFLKTEKKKKKKKWVFYDLVIIICLQYYREMQKLRFRKHPLNSAQRRVGF